MQAASELLIVDATQLTTADVLRIKGAIAAADAGRHLLILLGSTLPPDIASLFPRDY